MIGPFYQFTRNMISKLLNWSSIHSIVVVQKISPLQSVSIDPILVRSNTKFKEPLESVLVGFRF